MKTYLVGGAVRDELLGIPVDERDWVVVGETPESMIQKGFKQVGKDFPVFLHPETAEEYALARREYKQGIGHQGFKFDVSLDISLEEDLERRDLTINAIAQTPEGELIDPYGGQQDIEGRILRHVSDAFAEDPLRVLRLAQFYARLVHRGFSIAPETLSLCKEMVRSGELESLSSSRVFRELEKGLKAPTPSQFFEVLGQIDAIDRVMPGLNSTAARHLDAFAGERQPAELFALLCLKDPIIDLGDTALKLALPTAWLDLSQLARAFSQRLIKTIDLSATQVLETLEACDARRKPERFKTLIQIAVDAHPLMPEDQIQRRRFWQGLAEAVNAVTVTDHSKTRSGTEIKAQIQMQRLDVIRQRLDRA